MATEQGSVVERLKDITIEDLHDFSNIFSSEFNCSDIHDRALGFEIIKDEESTAKDHSQADFKNNSESGSNIYVNVDRADTVLKDPLHTQTTLISDQSDVVEVAEEPVEEKYTATTQSKAAKENKAAKEDKGAKEDKTVKENKALKEDQPKIDDKTGTGDKPDTEVSTSNELFGDEHELEGQKNKEECGKKDSYRSVNEAMDDKNNFLVSKLFVHSQWLAVQSSYFKALFYSGMKEIHSKEVVMKIHQHELEAHRTLIEAMYKLDVLKEKDYRLVVQVLVLAHKYDARHVFKKCKYVLLSTTPSLEMCEYILKEIKYVSDTADIHEMLENFLVKEFSPLDETCSLDKFFELSEAALKLLLGSNDLATLSEDTIFHALMEWVKLNIPCEVREKCDLLGLVRFEFLSVDYLYDVVQDHIVASKMPGLNKYFVKGLAYHAFSETRRENLEAKPGRGV